MLAAPYGRKLIPMRRGLYKKRYLRGRLLRADGTLRLNRFAEDRFWHLIDARVKRNRKNKIAP